MLYFKAQQLACRKLRIVQAMKESARLLPSQSMLAWNTLSKSDLGLHISHTRDAKNETQRKTQSVSKLTEGLSLWIGAKTEGEMS